MKDQINVNPPLCATCKKNHTRWDSKKREFKLCCSRECFSSNPEVIRLRGITYSESAAERKAWVGETLRSYDNKPRVKKLSEKSIQEFGSILTLKRGGRYYPREDEIMKLLPKKLLGIWCRLPVEGMLGRRMMALGQLPLIGECEVCRAQVTSYTKNGWSRFCGRSCQGKVVVQGNLFKDRKARAAKISKSMQKRMADPDHRERMGKIGAENLRSGMLRKYGTPNALQVPEIHRRQKKAAVAFKECTLRGKQVQVQGYEPIGLNYLIERFGSRGIEVETSGKVPSIHYMFKGKLKKHYPDMYYRPKNCLVEVKGIRELSDQHLFQVLKAKSRGAKDAGFNYAVLMVYRGWRYILPQGWDNMTFTQAKRGVTHEELSQAVRNCEYA